jgi:hypothetical protein
MIQYSATIKFNSGATEYWMPAGACHPAGQRPDRVAGMTKSKRQPAAFIR